MNSNHKKPPARNLTITGLILAGILAMPSLGHAEQVTHSYDNLNRLIRTDYGNGNIIDYAYDAAGNRTSQNSVTARVTYNFTGFFSPVDNLPIQNEVKAGSAVPVKFSLAGNQGLGILAAGYPKTQSISCSSTAVSDAIEETVTAGNSGLSYDAANDQYKYIWQTTKSWKGKCRQLIVKLNDGSEHKANFIFK
ncbi:MAG: PxKF domain-containing protein [Methylococcaceae bacterium]